MNTQRDKQELSRRSFLGTTGAAASAALATSALSSAATNQVSPNGKINLAFIGVGSQGLRVMMSFLTQPDVQIVAVCDVVKESAGYPQWSNGEFCNAVRRLLATDSGWEWLSPNQGIQLNPSLRATSGVAGREPARRIVEGYYANQKGSDNFKGCTAYRDYRELLEKEREVDAVVVCTPDHLHAPISIAAMRAGKHVFCQKPMTHNVYEARRMAEVARETGLASQVAVGVQASEDSRRIREWIAGGAIGSVREVVNWSKRPYWPQGMERPHEPMPVPEGLDWDLWLGPAPMRPFHQAYLPFVWRGWFDFGCGALGDMGCYSFDTVFRALELGAPTSVEASSSQRYQETFPQATLIRYNFPARGDKPAVRLTWYDGGLMPPRPDELEGERTLLEEGLMFIGDRGTILSGFSGARPRLLPESRAKEFQEPPKSLPRSPGNEREWLDAIKGATKTKPGANFEFSGMVTEALHLGNVALRAGERLVWDPKTLTASNLPAASRFIRREYREGWSL